MNDTPHEEGEEHKPRRSVFQRLRNWFLAGIAVTAPITITVYITVKFIEWVDDHVAALLPAEMLPSTYLRYNIPGLGLVLAVLSLTIVGFLTANFIGKWLLNIGETIVNRMPVVRGLYSALKQLFETVLSQSGGSYRQVVLVKWPHERMWTLAFVTTEQAGGVAKLTGEDMIGVYVPTTPNPTGGYFVYVPRKDAIPLAMTVDEGMKIVISTGVVQVSDPKSFARSNGA